MAKKPRTTACSAKQRPTCNATLPPETEQGEESASVSADTETKTAKTARKARAAKPKATRTTRTRIDAAHPRLKAYWAVCNQMMNVVSLFEYSERKAADRLAEELTESKKSAHFVQVVKRTLDE